MQGKETKGIKPRASIFRLMITKHWNVSTNTMVSYYYTCTHTNAYIKRTSAIIKIKEPSQERYQLRI